METEILDKLHLELMQYAQLKQELKSLKADKKRMSQRLYELMREKYELKSYEERCDGFRKSTCKDCRHVPYCDLILPENIQEPIESEKDWIQATKSCREFEWG